MKRLICSFVVLCLLATLPLAAMAAELDVRTNGEEKTQVITSYRTGNSLFSFIRFDGSPPSADAMTLLSPKEDRFKVTFLESCSKEHNVRLLLLIDSSGYMKNSRDTLMVFAKELMEKGPEKLSISVATQSKEYALLAKDITEWEELEGVLRSISYENWISNPCGGVTNALSSFDPDTYRNGEMLNLVVFTDGNSYFTDNPGTNQSYRRENLKQAESAIAEHPQVLVHSVIVKSSITEETKVLEQANGMHLRLSGDRLTEEDADALAEYLNGIHAVKVIDINIGTISLEGLCFTYKTQDGGDSVLHNIPLGRIADLTETVQMPQPIPEVVPETEQESQEPGEEANPEEPVQEVPSDGAETEEDPQGSSVPEDEESIEPSEENPGGNEVEQGLTISENTTGKDVISVWPVVAIVTVVVVVVAAIVVAIILIRSKRSGAIAMQLKVEYGRALNLKEWYYLKGSLIIGSGRNCDVVIPSSIVSKKNTRVYLENGQIYVEDLNSKGGTLLGGMKLHAPNRLRSGDVVTVGNTSIRFLF